MKNCFKAWSQSSKHSDVRKPVFKVSDKVRFKPACSATEKILLIEGLDMILSNKGITKALIRLGRYASVQAGLHLCCSQTIEDWFSGIEVQLPSIG